MFNRSKPKMVPTQKEIESMKDERQSRMSIQKRSSSQPLFQDIPLTGSSNQKTVDETDATIAWQYNVPIIMPNQKSIYLSTIGFTTVVQDYVGQDFPQTIYIAVDNTSGFIESNGVVSTKVIALTLCDINSVQSNGIVSRDLIYKNDMTCFWPLQRTLKMRVFLDEQQTPVNFPIQNPIALTFKIIHMTV